MPLNFGNALNNLVGGAVKTIDNAMKTQASSGNQGADNPIKALLKQYANQPGQSFAQPVQQQRQVLPQQFDTQTQVPAVYQQAYDSAQQIMQSGISNGVQQKETKKEDKAKRNQTMANAISGLLAGAAGPGAKNMLGVLIDNMDPEDAYAEEMDGKGKSEMKPDVTTEGSQNNEAKGVGARVRAAQKNPEAAQTNASKDSVERILREQNAPQELMVPYSAESPFFGEPLSPDVKMDIPDFDPSKYSIPEAVSPESPFDYNMQPTIDPDDIRYPRLGSFNNMSSEDVERAKQRVYPYGIDTQMYSQVPEPNDTPFTDAYGYLTTSLSNPDLTWDSLTNGTGYMQTTDGKWFDEDFNLYDENPNPENKTTEDRRQDDLEDEMRAMSEAQAFMLENPGATNGTYEGNRRMSQGGEAGKYAQEYGLGAEDLESMSDTELILNELARNEEFRNNMVENYGDLWNVSNPEDISALLDAQANLNNPFLSDYLVMNDNGYDDKRQMTQDLFLDSGMDPVVRTQLLQRIYNQNQKNGQDVDQLADILRRDARGEELSQEDKDYLTQNIMDTYFANPIDFAEWALSPDSAYAVEHPFNYADQVAWMGSAAAMNPTIAATIADLGLDAADLGSYLAAGNQLNLGDTWMDRNNGPLTEHWYDYLGQLLNDAGYASEWNRDIAKKGDKEAEKLKKRFTDSGKSHNMGDLLTAFMQNAGDPNAIAQALNIVGGEDMYDPSFGDIPFDLLADYRGVPISQYGLGTSRYINPKSINELKEA